MRLIDADEFFMRAMEVSYLIVHGHNDHENGLTLSGIAQLLDETPTVDAVEVVRCKDCKYRQKADFGGIYTCAKIIIGSVEDDDYCSYGQKR